MEFIPVPKIMHKLIERATQLDLEKIDTCLNPYDLLKVETFITEAPSITSTSEGFLGDMRCKQKNFYYPDIRSPKISSELGLTKTLIGLIYHEKKEKVLCSDGCVPGEEAKE